MPHAARWQKRRRRHEEIADTLTYIYGIYGQKKVSHILLSPIWVCRWIEDDLCVIADGITCFKYTETGPWPLENCEGMGKSMGFSDERGSAIFCHDFSILFVWLDLWSRNEIYPKHMRISHNFA
jgi:hypothetical protein